MIATPNGGSLDVMGRRLLGSLACAAMVVAAAPRARAEGRPAYGGRIVGSLLGEPASIDPVDARSYGEIALVGLVFDTLYQIGADGAVTPHLAAGPPQVAADGLHVVIPLRPAVRFQDGHALGARDVAASLDRLARSDAGWLLASVAQLGAAGDAVELTLRAPTPDLATLLAQPQTAITPNGAPPAARAPIGSGPFRVVRIDRRRRRILLRAWDGHFAGRPYLDELELRWFTTPDGEARQYEAGGAALSLRGETAFVGHQPKYETARVESPASVLELVGFGRAHRAVLADPDFRAALSLAIARSGFAAVGTGERVAPAIDPVPVELGGTLVDGAARTGDPAAARARLARAARTVPQLAPAQLARLRLEVVVDRTRPDDREVAERVVRALDKLGIAATITAEGSPAFAARVRRGNLDLWIGELPVASAAPAVAWAAAFEAGGDPWARGQLAGGSLDPAQARARFAAALPVVPLYFRAVRVHYRTDVRGLGFDGMSRPDLADVFLFGSPVRARGRP